jgi:hypothetical protein
MKMKSLCVCTAVFVCLAAWSGVAQASAAECPAYIPAGVVIRVLPDEKLRAGSSSGPTILTVSSDVRFFPNRPPLLTRGSKVLGTIVESKQAGHFHGKARLRITLGSILNSDFCEYPIDAKIVEAGRNRVEDDVVWGRGHAHRDLIALLFPPTTIYQLVRTPSRGPKLVLDNETPLSIKLLEPVSLGAPSNRLSENDQVGPLPARLEQIQRDLSAIKAALSQKTSPFHEQQPASLVSEPCSQAKFTAAAPLVRTWKVLRPVRNLTPYHVSVYLDRTQVLIMPPCFGPSMIATPATAFRLEAAASMLTPGGQRQIAVRVVPSAAEAGWDIVADAGEPVAFRSK